MQRIGRITPLAVCQFQIGLQSRRVDFELDILQIYSQGFIADETLVVGELMVGIVPGGVAVNDIGNRVVSFQIGGDQNIINVAGVPGD